MIFTFRSLKKHYKHVAKVLQRLKDARLQLNINKYKFEIEFTKYLKFIIEVDKDICMNSIKIKVIIKWKASCSIKSIHTFIEFANFYHYFIK